MPQGQRKKPFSAKQKKEQLKARRERKKRGHDEVSSQLTTESADISDSSSDTDERETVKVQQLNQQPAVKHGKKYDPNRYKLHFHGDSAEEIKRNRELASEPLTHLPQDAMETDIEDIYKPGSVLDLPKRPLWDYSMTKQQVLAKEEVYFKNYLDNMLEKHNAHELSYFELNLETWRQLWRVLEMSDIILLITDIRHPALHFSPSVYNFVVHELKKTLILVLNKIDLAPAGLVSAWRHYFTKKFPGLHVVCFTSQPQEETASDSQHKVFLKRKRRGGRSAMGPKQLLQACESIVQGAVDLQSWQEKIVDDEEDGGRVGDALSEADTHVEEDEGLFHSHQKYRDGILTIGCCGYPNVGKSSMMNALVGKKVVSVSRTPGHTKHFQTIYLTPTVKLCDSPGLVFPSLIPKPVQILAGIYPIAQVREPYSAVAFLSQRLSLPDLLKLTHPDGSQAPWSALDICSAWAERRGYLTAKAARPDMYRAANHILRLAVEGRICLCMRPPGYSDSSAEWENDEFTLEITRLMNIHGKSVLTEAVSDADSDSSERDSNCRPSDESDEDVATVSNNPFSLLMDD